MSQLRDQDCHSDNVSRLAAPKRNLRYQRNTLFCPLLRLLYRGHSEPDTAHHLWERVFLPALEECPSSCAEVFLYISELLEDIMCLNQKADAFDLRSEDSFWVYLQVAFASSNSVSLFFIMTLLSCIDDVFGEGQGSPFPVIIISFKERQHDTLIRLTCLSNLAERAAPWHTVICWCTLSMKRDLSRNEC